MTYQFDKRKPGETVEEYLKRHKAHPSQSDRRSATPEEMAASNVTAGREGGGVIITVPNGAPRLRVAQATKKISKGDVMTKKSVASKLTPSSHLSVAWAPFAQKLAAALAKLEEDQFLILSVKRSDRFVQFATQGSFGMRIETTSNSYLAKPEKLNRRQISTLIDAGWGTPTGRPADSTPEDDPDGSPNFFVEFSTPVSFEEVANLTVRTFADILRVPHPGSLEYEAFDEEGDAIAMPDLGLRLAKGAQRTDSQEDLSKVSAIRDCALIMLENASYIQRELPNVEMLEALRLQTAEVCESMVGTKHDVISEIFEINELLKSKTDWAVVSSRIDRVIRGLWEDISKMHQVVMALREDSHKNENHTSSLVLVQESAANIVNAFNCAKAAVDALASEKK